MGKTASFNVGLDRHGGEVRRKALEALNEDAQRDITSEAAIPAKLTGKAAIVANEPGVFCGIVEARAVFGKLKVTALIKEGEPMRKGQKLLFVSGSLREILRCERTALNYISLLSGIATAVSRFNAPGRVAGLRKTHPLLNLSERRAVKVGGGITHRLTLGDGILVKDNHITAIARELGCSREEAIAKAVGRIKKGRQGTRFPIEVEASTISEAVSAAESGADAVLLDNLSPAEGKRAAKAARKMNQKIIIEASGGITYKTARAYLKFADFVSSSEVALKARPIDVSLDVE